ncbi:MAG: beta-glucosidase-related glycosidase [Clostridia bacterium]|nr:beta-glucosidase-related glycosidase [Clostridia bacterium]NCD03552.1 beta-glucosidase-related glycosidase [Clostridia bacterium]
MELLKYEKQHLQAVRKILPECMVLLKKDGDFPLNKSGKIALYGSGARHTIKGGTGSGEVNSRFFVTVEQGLEEAGFIITTKKWLDAYDQVRDNAHERFVKEIKQRARKNHTLAVMEGMGAVMPEPEYKIPLRSRGETAIYVLSRISGEGNDRKAVGGDILLSETEKRDILTLSRNFNKFLLVLNVGGPVDLTPVQEVDNILLLSQLGVETGRALADVILGKATPSGKLATTWAAWDDASSIGEFGNLEDTRYFEGIYVGYRYYDSIGKRPLYPFGYGLSYTEFEIKTDKIIADGEKITAMVRIKNIGKYPGKEVVQLYVSLPQARLDQPYQVLAGWNKTKKLMPGKEEQIEITFALSELSSYDTENSAYILEKGDYILRIGNSSRDTSVCGIANLDKDVQVMKTHRCCGETSFQDWKPKMEMDAVEYTDVPRLLIASAEISKKMVHYDSAEVVDSEIQKLTDEELAYINVGAFNPKAGALSIIGNASMTVVGAAGETSGIRKSQGFPVLVMADGPAGVRLSKDYTIDKKKGALAVGNTMPASMGDYLPKIALGLMKLMQKKPHKKAAIRHHYATAIPIGTALAQSWNLQAAKTCGDIVGAEMERFGVHLWLAPALNIHRSIQCGRNFEYFSEEPLISGKFAAALTKGVQRHPGCGTTIKHFAANNQETNRYNNNSQVSERAMREIYLRGFEICVKEAQPHALMTSYNLLNGRHTAKLLKNQPFI